VLVASAYAMLLMDKDAREADGVLQKPFGLPELLSGVNDVVRQRGLVQAEGGRSGVART
jgi:hypothetical protein